MTPSGPGPRRWIRRAARAAARGLGRRPDPVAAHRELGRELVPLPSITADPERDRRPALVVLLPSLEVARLTGGPNTAINLAARLAARGVRIRFVATRSGPNVDRPAVLRHVALVSGLELDPDRIEVEAAPDRGGQLRVGRGDRLLATWWPTAHVARAALAATDATSFFYLVQDYEPAFYPWSTEHALARETYGFPIVPIYNEALLRSAFVAYGLEPEDRAARGGSFAFEPAVDRGLFRPIPRDPRPTALFYARPRNPRNLFELGLASLRAAVAAGAFDDERAGRWRFVAIGDQAPDLSLGAGHVLERAPWMGLEAYAARLGSADLLLSLMLSPHTSYPPLEMAATGGRVVTNAFEVKTAAALRGISGHIAAAEPTVTDLAAHLATAAVDAVGDRLADRGNEPGPAGDLRLPGTWAESLDPVVDWMLPQLGGLLGP